MKVAQKKKFVTCETLFFLQTGRFLRLSAMSNMLPSVEIVLPQAASQTGSNVPAFLAKLWQMVNDPRTNDIISWSPDGRSFVIHNQSAFAQTQLPYYYKHSNMSSFVRQLNMYDFHKVVGVESGGLKSERQEEMEFQHQFFLKGMKGLLENIKRKVSTNKAAQYLPSIKTEKVNEVLNEVNNIRDKQDDLDSKLDSMKKENEALWREVVNLRQKHQAQQKIVNKLIQFLVSMVQPRMAPAVKRRYQSQLAIEGSQPKEMRLEGGVAGGDLVVTGDAAGPNIRDITNEDAASKATTFSVDSLMNLPSVATTVPTVVNVELPVTPDALASTSNPPSFQQRSHSPLVTSAAMRAVDPSLINPAINVNVGPSTSSKTSQGSSGSTVVAPSRPTLMRELSKEDLDLETTFTQKDLDNLKESLSGQINLDPSLLTNLFSPEEPLPNLVYNMATPSSGQTGEAASGPSSSSPLRLQMEGGKGGGNGAVATVTPSLLELAEMDDDHGGADAGGGASLSGVGATVTPDALNTPLVFSDDTDPLVFQIKK